MDVISNTNKYRLQWKNCFDGMEDGLNNGSFNYMAKVKVNFVLQQAMKAEMGSKGIFQLFL
jgi:hypothetical protein